MSSIQLSSLRLCLLLPCLSLASCVFYPKQEDYYDPVCQVDSKKFSLALNPHPILPLRSCYNTDCFDMLADALFYIAAEAALTTAVVTAGNTAYYIDRQVQCINPNGEHSDSSTRIEEETIAPKPPSPIAIEMQ